MTGERGPCRARLWTCFAENKACFGVRGVSVVELQLS